MQGLVDVIAKCQEGIKFRIRRQILKSHIRVATGEHNGGRFRLSTENYYLKRV
jgi:hypothetical protein